MATFAQKLRSAQHLNLFTNGGLQMGPLQEFYPLAGLTLTLTTPAASCAFVAGADPKGLRVGEINSQLAGSALSALKVVPFEGALWLIEIAPQYGLVFGAGAQTARQVLGLPPSGAITTSVMGPIGSAKIPNMVAVFPAGTGEIMLIWSDSSLGSQAPSSGGTSIANPALAHTPLDPPSRAIFIGGDGDLVVHRVNDDAGVYTTYKGLKAPNFIPVAADEVRSDTTATDLVIEQQLGDHRALPPLRRLRVHGAHQASCRCCRPRVRPP